MKNIKTKINYKDELNDEQYKVVTTGEGYCLVLAGAGSGKTRTLVYRVAYLIEHGVDPANIMLVTFTNKAAREMLDRVTALVSSKLKGMWGGTFHHIANIILRKYATKLGYTSSFNILDEDDNKQLLKTCLTDLEIDTKERMFPKVDIIKNILSFAQNSNTGIEAVINDRYSHLPPSIIEDFIKIAEYYSEKKRRFNVMTFDDMLANWLKLLKEFPEVKVKLGDKCHYILVDEYQDTNVIQNEIVHLMSEGHQNLLVVGDDAQSIYSFRAATVANILEFEKRYENVKTFRLETNYRSTPEILELANASISYNAKQYPKNLKSLRDSHIKPALVPVKDSYQQASFIAQRLSELRDEGYDLRDMAVLFRSSFHIIELELELNKRGVPYHVRGGLRFFEQAHIKDVISFLRIMANSKDELAWRRVLTMFEGIGNTTANKIYEQIVDSDSIKTMITALTGVKLSQRSKLGVNKVINVLTELEVISQQEQAVASSLALILKDMYQDYLKTHFENYHERLLDLEQLINFSAQYGDVPSFLTEITLSESFKGERGHENDVDDHEYLILSTIHQAKGLEWPVVFVVGLADGQFPHYKVLENDIEMSEERRLFYVAVTRAKDELYCMFPIVSSSVATGYKINQPSTFVSEVGPEFFEVWQIAGVDTSVLGWGMSNNDDIDVSISDTDEFSDMGILDRVAEVNKRNQGGGDGFYEEDAIEYS